MKVFEIRDRQTGTVIDYFYSFEDAQNQILLYEQEDKENDEFSKDYYEIITIEMKYNELMSTKEFCELLTHLWGRTLSPINDLCFILENGQSTRKYSKLGNHNTKFYVEYRNKYLKRTESMTVFEIANYDIEKDEYVVKGYIVEP